MCGIFGIIDLRLPDLEHLIRATHLLRHRGPDDWGVVALLPNKAQGVLSPGLKNARVQAIGLHITEKFTISKKYDKTLRHRG